MQRAALVTLLVVMMLGVTGATLAKQPSLERSDRDAGSALCIENRISEDTPYLVSGDCVTSSSRRRP